MIGNEDARIGFLQWLRNWSPKSRPALLLGPPGTGKTTIVHASAKALDYRVFELNASDKRTKDHLESILGPATTSQSLFSERRLIFLDEVDGLYGRQDYGGLDFVQDLMTSSLSPLVMAANKEEDDKVRKLAGRSTVYRFKPVPPRLLEVYLKNLLTREGLSLPDEVLQDIASRSRGDVRGAVNDLQMAAEQPPSIPVAWSFRRDYAVGSREAVDALSRCEKYEDALGVLRRWDLQPQDKIRVLFSSILGSGLDGDSLRRALEVLARADELLGEIGKTQEWRLLRYFDRIVASGLLDAVPKTRLRFYEDNLAWSLKLRIWNEGRVFRHIRDEVSKRFRVSRGEAVSIMLPYFAVVLGAEKTRIEKFAGLLRLEESEVKVLEKEVSRVKSLGD